MGNQANKLLQSPQSQKESIFSPVVSDEKPTLFGKMPLKTRIMGWIACSAIGMGMSFIVSICWIFTSFDVVVFAIMYTLGQILNIVGSCFLSTPQGHWKDMKKRQRIIPSCLYVGSIILTLVFALATNIKGLVLISLIIQIFAYYWYTITFIPFGQRIVKKLCMTCFDL